MDNMTINKTYEKLGLFYLGNELDIQTQQKSDDLLLVKNKNLTTHAAIIGMTGSGKTGLGISLIEEAVLDKIPSIIIDPKGDMGNLLLAFDEFKPSSFEPWIDPHNAQKHGIDIDQEAQNVAQMWEKGIKSSFQDRDRVKRYKNGAEFTIYTPGSSAGISLSVLSSFDAPSSDILEDSDTFSYILGSSVTSILALIDIEADPLQSKEYMLLSSIFSYFWRQEVSLSLEELIGHVTNPPFKKIGVLPLKSFYPQKERLKLAMLLNNVLASPTFAGWTEGEALDIDSLLYTSDAKPKVSILSISHLNDNERMFFVTLFLNRYISWMRLQSGTSDLKTLLYMDEIYGFFPATSNPPSKSPMLLLLKQARAYGIGVVLSTQNPVDIDYKGLSNIGSWFIGRLQTKQDIQRVINGLIKSGSNALSKKNIEELLSNLKKRVFLFKSAHRDEVELFSTRWVMSYLKGPLSKKEISTLMKNKKEQLSTNQAKPIQQIMAKDTKKTDTSTTPPPLSDEFEQYYYCHAVIEEVCSVAPNIIANATVRFYNAKRDIDIEKEVYLKIPLTSTMEEIEFDKALFNDDDFSFYDSSAPNKIDYTPLPNFILEAKNENSIEKKFSDYLYRNEKLTLYKIEEIKLESNVNEELRAFKIRVQDFLKEQKEQKIETLKHKYEKKRSSIERKYNRALERLEKEESDVSSKTTDTMLSFGMTILDAFLGRKSLKRSTTRKAGSTIRNAGKLYKEKDDVQRAMQRVQELEDLLKETQYELEDEIDSIDSDYDIENFEIKEFYINPRRSDIFDTEIALLWERM
jgi:hypothetical protein